MHGFKGVSIFHRYRVVLRFVNPCFANQNDFRKEEGRRFGLTSVQRSVGPHTPNVRSMKCDDKGDARKDCDKRYAKIGITVNLKRTVNEIDISLSLSLVSTNEQCFSRWPGESVSMSRHATSRMDNCE